MRLRPYRNRSNQRSAFTLLEMLLASAIGVLLMAALYVAMNVQLRQAQAAREVVEESALVRFLLERISNDIAASLPPPASSTSSQTTSSASASPAAAGAGGSTASGGGTSGASQAAATANPGTPSVFNLGLQGSTNQITVYMSRLPSEVIFPPSQGTDMAMPVVGDMRRITYWLAGSGSKPLGLARQEIKLATTDPSNAPLPPDLPDEANLVIAEEVRSLEISYFDGTAWQDSWDGTALQADGVTPLGPPIAVAITLGIAAPGSDNGNSTDLHLKQYRHVVTLPTANGAPQQTPASTTGQ